MTEKTVADSAANRNNPVVLHVAWPDGNQQWLPITDPKQPIPLGSGAHHVDIPVYGAGLPEVTIVLRGSEIPGMTLLPAGPCLEVGGEQYPVHIADGSLYVDADPRHHSHGIGLLRTCGLALDGQELGADGLSDTAVAREYVAACDPGLTLSTAERAEAVATVHAALPTLRQMAGGAS